MKNIIISMVMLSMFSLSAIQLNSQNEEIEINYQLDELARKETVIGLADNKKDDFIQGIKSPYEEHIWFFSSRGSIKEPTDFYKYNSKTKEISKIFDSEITPVNNYSLTPFAFGKDPNIIYLEAFDYINGGYHLGIWEYHLITNKFKAISIDKMYMGTPVLDVDRNNFYYPSTTETTRDLVHGSGNISFEYNIEGQSNKILDNNVKLIETSKDGLAKAAPDCLAPIQTSLPYYFPYASGEPYCIGRLGNSPPCPNGIPNTCQGTECPHGNTGDGNCTPRNVGLYIATDITNPGGVTQNPIYSCAFGRVSFSGWQSGYGNSVEIQHIDGYYTFYAHLDEILVSYDEIVNHATIIGKEGNTGDSYGEHLHFEVRSQSGVRGSDYVEFAEFNNQVPNYGNEGFTFAKPPPITFVSNVDLAPDCSAMTVSSSDVYLFVSDLTINNLGDALSGPYTVYYTLKNSYSEYEVGDIYMPGLNAFSSTPVSPLALSITAVPPGTYELEIYVETDDFANNPNPLSEYDLFNNDCFASTPVNITGGPTCSDGIQNQGETGIDCGGPCLPCTPSTCTYFVTNNTNCEVQLLWYTGVTYVWGTIIPPYGTGSDQIQNGVYQWTAYNTLDFTPISSSWTTAYCSSPYGSIAASACSDNSSCSFTITNNTDCEVRIFWTDLEGDYWNGAIIPPNGSATESVNDGDAWSAYNTYDNELITPYFEYAWCNSPYGNLSASACNNSCNYTFTNNTTCEVELFWTDNNGNFWNGSIVQPNGTSVQSVGNGYAWSAYNTSDGSLITPTSVLVDCDSPSGSLAASACDGTVCDPDGNFSGTHNGSLNYHAENYITAPGAGNVCNIQASANVSLRAGNYIVMKPGFHAKQNSTFLARIEDCDNVLPLQAPSEDNMDNVYGLDGENFSVRNYPNPFNQITTIEYNLPSDNNVSIRVFNAAFQEVATLVNQEFKVAGKHSVEFNGNEFLPGMYFYCVQAGEYRQTQKMILVR